MTDAPAPPAPEPPPLHGIRVLEFTHMIMGPSCAMVLADLGADVIKVEPGPDGDNTRRLTGAAIGFFPTFNRNKRSLCLDLKQPAGIALVQRLARDADVAGGELPARRDGQAGAGIRGAVARSTRG